MSRLLLLAWVVLALTLGATPAHAIPPADAISRVNAIRVANGIPALVEDANLNAGCQSHARYMALNGGWDEPSAHDQTPGKPGYSLEGAQAARGSVLAGALGWMDPHPWIGSPEHTRQLMDPELAKTGYGEDRGWMCMFVGKEPRPDLTGRVFTMPGPGSTGVPVDQELIVYTPGVEHVDLHAPRLTSAVGGAIAMSSTAKSLFPRGRLAPGTTYTAEVDLRHSATRCSREGAPPVYPACPTRFAPWCYASMSDAEPVWLPAESEPYDPVLCAPGQRPPASANAEIKARSVPYHWQFTTAGNPVTCPSAVTAPSRLARATTMNVHVQMCTASSVRVDIQRGGKRVLRRSSSRPDFRVFTRNLRAGRYTLVVTVGRDTHQHPFTVR